MCDWTQEIIKNKRTVEKKTELERTQGWLNTIMVLNTKIVCLKRNGSLKRGTFKMRKREREKENRDKRKWQIMKVTNNEKQKKRMYQQKVII